MQFLQWDKANIANDQKNNIKVKNLELPYVLSKLQQIVQNILALKFAATWLCL